MKLPRGLISWWGPGQRGVIEKELFEMQISQQHETGPASVPFVTSVDALLQRLRDRPRFSSVEPGATFWRHETEYVRDQSGNGATAVRTGVWQLFDDDEPIRHREPAYITMARQMGYKVDGKASQRPRNERKARRADGHPST